MNDKRSRKCLQQAEYPWSFDDVISIDNLSFANLTPPLFCRANIKHMATSAVRRFDILCIKVNIMTQLCPQLWCSRGYTLLTSGEHIISLRGAWAHKISLNPQHFIEVPVPSRKSPTKAVYTLPIHMSEYMCNRKKAIKSMYLFACLTVIFNILDQNIIGMHVVKLLTTIFQFYRKGNHRSFANNWQIGYTKVVSSTPHHGLSDKIEKGKANLI